ncbi:ParA family protein [Deinococcus cellulosilyticus]|uniref:Chromosome partitioning protein Soj n=1 Tax=Deinococcus cellulosilyticus (strain DSM 18568 / NBRC 106333 / KACC 11606 / 5516J-15) TaxID=1223518 RepID=A0A511N9I4_DEIC1|nr:ParA family protein [Deinococcus cellulosilyticus]GEM49493.1 chromosome partitioning protein Soj [Deinococcus cellulosilyticus NBRC 106333 = KACC 11606]
MKVLALVNQKGGVGKTTTAVNLAAYLANTRRRILVVDIDPQANASSGLGVRGAEAGVYDALREPARLSDFIQQTEIKNLHVLPATPDLAGAGVELTDEPDALKNLLAGLEKYDLVLIDAPPSLGPLTINALVAADALIVPLQAEYYALEGIAGLMDTIERVRDGLNPALQVLGIVITMFDGRTNLSVQIEENVRNHFGDLVFWSVIPRNVRLSEAPSHAKPINLYSPMSSGAGAYKRLSDEVMQRVKKI